MVDATSNCRAFGGPESAQPTSAIPAAKSPSGRRTTRGITAEYYPLSARLPLALVTPNGPARAWGFCQRLGVTRVASAEAMSGKVEKMLTCPWPGTISRFAVGMISEV